MDRTTSEKKAFAKSLEERTMNFAVLIIKLATLLPDTPEGRVVRYQICKSSTSIGANYREANRARSKADFKSKIKICESEASETNYWLEESKYVLCKKESLEILSLFLP